MEQQEHILIIGTVWPEPGSSAAGTRMMQLIKLFLQQQYTVTFASAAAYGDHSANLEELGVKKAQIELNNGSFNEFIKALNPHIVLFDRFMTEEQYGWRVAEAVPSALRVLDTEDLHCLRYAREIAFKQGRAQVNDDLFNQVAIREIAAVYRCDLSLIISAVEMELLRNVFKISDDIIHYLPFLFEGISGDAQTKWLSFNERHDFISIGNFLHEPNRNAVLYLKEIIWPLIRKQLPGAQLQVFGAYPTQQVLQLNKPSEGFLVKGRAEDARQAVSHSRVSLAPLRIGAGLKGKLAEAMLCGTPSVTTSIGAEGMHEGMDWGGIIADDPETFATAAVQLYTDRQQWHNSQANGVKIINTLFSAQQHGTQFLHRLNVIKENLDAHRMSNFIGTMLHHHTTASAMYMSRWIEEKNRK